MAHNPFRGTKPMTIALFLLVCLWAVFQWRDPSPPPVLDQILVAAFGVWFANEAIDKKNDAVQKALKGFDPNAVKPDEEGQ